MTGQAIMRATGNHRDEGVWPRVTSRNPCVICGNRGYCQVSPDGTIAKCMRQSLGAFKTRNETEYYHRIAQAITIARTISTSPQRSTKAEAPELNAAYTALFDKLPLSESHARHLVEARKLSEETITRGLYATTPMPHEAEKIVTDLLAERVSLEGVPGFYKRNGLWSMVAVPQGFFVPVRDYRGRIVGAQIRLDESRGTRYLWFSSADRGAVSSGAPIHFAMPHRSKALGHILVTEGPLKADIIAERLHAPAVGIPGINAQESAGAAIREAFPQVQVATLLPDADMQSKPEVRDAALKLGRILERAGFRVQVITWDGALGKGFDDLLVAAGVQVR